MNIAFLDLDDIRNPLMGAGQARATVEVGKRLVQMGHSVTSYCSKYPGYRDRTEFGIRFVHIGINTPYPRLNNAAYLFAAPLHARTIRADIIVECFTSPISTLCSPMFTRVPVVALPTSFDAKRHSELYHLPFTWIERFGARQYKYFMPYTQAYLDKMRRYNPTIDASIIPEGVSDEFFHIRQKTPKYILSLGRIEFHQKGLDLLLESYAKIKHKSYPLIIAGKGNHEAMIQKLIHTHHLEKSVKFVGPAYGDKKTELLSGALYVAMPSRNEGFPLFSLEALAAGLPIMVFDIPGFSWTQSAAVVKAKPFDTRDYARILEQNMDTATITPRRAVAKATARPYSWDNVANKMEEYFQYVLRKEQHV
jgi:glycosyltransferase involved in cell wall biosynthesis